ncbi:bifunctional DNA primase/polymerase [Amorphus orientalis]|uniref:DNA primase/polymerase bifunctional N-terminal domain-containing protein n=1 Tax=Amorphus orientalis TaxID=649198 RepID=A0AAE4AUT9_9HYPH|nr:bifunctional DNA primase/polymerase [Amorphus orientalis]MDQ0317775.1 hypothetical protein [Amorphus orientalis]
MIKDAKRLIRAGFAVHLLRKKSKAPVNENWSKAPRLSYDQFCRRYKEGHNIGVRLGEPSLVDGLYLHVIDMDIRVDEAEDDAYAALHDLFPGVDLDELPTVKSGSGGASRHFYFGTTEPFPSKKLAKSKDTFVDREGKKHREWEIELFGTGKQVALPPSIHPVTEKKYRWLVEFDEIDGLPEIDADRIADLIYGDDYDPYSTDIEPLGLTIEEAEAYIEDLDANYWCEDRDGWRNLGMALKHEFSDDPELEAEAFDLWCDYSKRSEKYEADKMKGQWRSFKGSTHHPITMRTIVKFAEEQRLIGAFDDDDYDDDDDDDDEETEAEPVEDDGAPRLSDDEIIALFDDEVEPGEEVVVVEKPSTRTKPSDPGERHAEAVRKVLAQGIPERLLSIPGALQDVVEYYNRTAYRPQPQFAVQAALGFGSVVLGRNWSSDQDNFTSLYLMGLGRTGSGKEHILTTIQKLLEASRLDSLIGPKTYSSEAGVLSKLIDYPRHIALSDEIGRYLASARNSGNANKLDMQSALMEAFGRLDGIFQGIAYSSRGMTKEQSDAQSKNNKIVRPALSLVTMSVPQKFYEALGEGDVADGFLNRFLIVESPIGRQKTRRIVRAEKWVSDRLIKWARKRAWATPGEDGEDDIDFTLLNDPTTAPEPNVIPFSDECQLLLDEMDDEVNERMDRLEASGMDALYARTREIAMRVAVIVAISCESDQIELEHLKWARDYVFFYHDRMAKLFIDNLGKDATERAGDSVVHYLEKKGDEGAPEHKIRDALRPYFSGMNLQQRREVFDRLIADRRIRPVEKTGSRGKKGNRFAIIRRPGQKRT